MSEKEPPLELRENVFYKTPPGPCPYLPDQIEERMLTPVSGDAANDLTDFLTEHGFRRSRFYLYKPICAACRSCLSVRIPVNDFPFTKSRRRILNLAKNLQRSVAPPKLTQEQYRLFRTYIEARHGDDDMANMNFGDLRQMVEDTPTQTFITEYRDITKDLSLAGWVLCDGVKSGFSMLYSVFQPDFSKQSPGSFAILDHVLYTKQREKKYLYLGYWVPNSKKMDYKKRFIPLEIRERENWILLKEAEDAENFARQAEHRLFTGSV